MDETSNRRVRDASFPQVARQTPVQRMFLGRLRRLVLLDRYGQTHAAFSEPERFLIKKATYSVYRDCVELDVLREARAIIRSAARSTSTARSGG